MTCSHVLERTAANTLQKIFIWISPRKLEGTCWAVEFFEGTALDRNYFVIMKPPYCPSTISCAKTRNAIHVKKSPVRNGCDPVIRKISAKETNTDVKFRPFRLKIRPD